MNSNYSRKLAVRVLYPCYICGSSYTKGPLTIDHITSMHDKNLPKRPTGRKRPKNEEYTYIGINGSDWDEIHYGCCSCWFHTNDIKELHEHVKKEHDPNKESKNYDPYDKQIVNAISQKITELREMFSRIL